MNVRRLRGRRLRLAVAALLTGVGLALIPTGIQSVTAAPTSVTAFGDFQSELGCASDDSPGCVTTHLLAQPDGTWRATFAMPAGSFTYKIAINDTFDENYGAGGASNGASINFTVPVAGPVTFVYDATSHYTSNSAIGPIVTLVGTFQSEIGCSSDFAPDCLRSWLIDPDGDGVYTFAISSLPAGTYDAKVTHGLSFDENYGAGGVANGPQIPFTTTPGVPVYFSYVLSTHVLTITVGAQAGPTVTVTQTATVTATATVTTTSTVTATVTATVTVTAGPSTALTPQGSMAAVAGAPSGTATAQLAATGTGSTVRLLIALLLIAFGVILAMIGSWPSTTRRGARV